MSSSQNPAQTFNLDINQQQAFVRYFNNLPEKPPSTVRFFNRSDLYTLHGDDANLAADFFSQIVKYMGSEPKLSYICINKAQMENLLRELLLVRQYRVEVYVKSSQSRNNDWTLEYRGSPGNLTQFDEVLFQNANIDFSNCVMGIQLVKNNVLGIANVNVTELKFELCEINDDDKFTELEAVLAQIGPRECVIPSSDSKELIELKNVLDRNGILVAKVKKSDYNVDNNDDIMQDLNRLLYFAEDEQRNASGPPECAFKEALGSLQAVIKFLNLTADEINFNQYKLSLLEAKRFVRLDNAALYALHVHSQPGTQTDNASVSPQTTGANKASTLFGVLNHCVTSQGRRLLEQWIKQPLKDFNLINERLDVVVALVRDKEVRTTVTKDCLTRMPDLMFLSKRLSSKRVKLQDCYKLYQAVNSLPSLIQTLKQLRDKCVNAMLIEPLGEFATDLQKFQCMIEETLDLDLVDRGEFMIKCTISEEMMELYKQKQRVEEKMQKLLRRAADDLNFEEGKNIKLECTPQHGYVFRVTKREEQSLRQNKSYKIVDALTGCVRFTNDKLTDLNSEYSGINSLYEEKQKGVVESVLEVAAGYSDVFRSLNLVISTLDVLTSFASAAVAARTPYVRPTLHPAGSGILKMRKVRHPCLEQQEHVSFVPNDVEFDKDEKTLYIITGPNMCGKSTYIRSVGVCVLMAHIGSLVPCLEAEISLVDGILARVGADDCQLKGLSTFMLEMIETASILKNATENSLVIIDELGRGTSTYDGYGIAMAIAEHLAKEIKCFSLFATHFHEITKLADSFPNVGNLHVTALTTNNTITPLYQIGEGECDKSYGVHCARLAGFPPDVIEWATEHLKELEHDEGMKYIKDFEVSVKKNIVKEGNEIVRETLKKLKCCADNMSEDELMKELQRMKTELESSENLFVKGLLSASEN